PHRAADVADARDRDDAEPSRPLSADDQSCQQSAADPIPCGGAPHRSPPAPLYSTAEASGADDSNDPPPNPMNVALLAKLLHIDATTDAPSPATRSGRPRPACTSSHPQSPPP